MKDYYAILGVPREAEADLIKATYLALSKIYHPDIYKGDKKYALKRMQEINEAYAQAYAQDCSIAKAETDVLGISHADDGLHAGIEWQFSVLLVNVIGRHQLAIRPDSAAPKDQTGTLSAARNTHRRRGQLRPRLRHAALPGRGRRRRSSGFPGSPDQFQLPRQLKLQRVSQ